MPWRDGTPGIAAGPGPGPVPRSIERAGERHAALAEVVPVKSMQAQLDKLARSAPAQRIELREAILAHGAAVVAPLADLVAADPELGPSVTAWLEVLGKRDQEALNPVVAALRTLTTSASGDTRRHATEALARLGVPLSAARARRAAAAKA